MQVKVGLQIAPRIVVNFEELLSLSCQFLRHV